jgi:hypothetical protein
MAVRFCTLFDSRYTARGLVMLRSLDAYRKSGDEIVVLTMDRVARQVVDQIGQGRWHSVTLTDLGDAELLTVKETRPSREFCWTCTPALSAWMVRTSCEGDIVVYADADLMFFCAPQVLLSELGDDGSILIHEHRFSPDRTEYEKSSGRFNVGFVGFRVGDEARACVERWRSQSIELCILDPDNGHCGDQGYLNEWPTRYPNLRIMRNIGGGVAPWNVNQYVVDRMDGEPVVDGVPVVFFHYHSLKTVHGPALGFIAADPAYGYEFPRKTVDVIFQPYARRLRQASRDAARVGLTAEPDRVASWPALMKGVLRSQCVLAI